MFSILGAQLELEVRHDDCHFSTAMLRKAIYYKPLDFRFEPKSETGCTTTRIQSHIADQKNTNVHVPHIHY